MYKSISVLQPLTNKWWLSYNDIKFNEINEYLFWKVIHNKFIFKLIINKIETLESYIYDDYKQKSKRIKFKDIKSIEWMLNKRQYELLKCKIIANEFIEIINPVKQQQQQTQQQQELPIQKLFLNQISNENDLGPYKEIELINKENEIHRLKSKKIISLLLKFKISELNKIDFNKLQNSNSTSTSSYNLEIFDLLCKNEFLINNNNSLLEFIIMNLSPQPLQSLTIQIPKDKSISLAFKNKLYKEEMLEFILNNSLSSNKRLKQQHLDVESNNEIIEILKIKSMDIKLKLLNNLDFQRIKEIHKSYSINNIELYRYYLEIYDEPINEINEISIIYKYALESFSFNLLNYFISKLGRMKFKISRVSICRIDLIKNRNLNSILEFIKLYSINYNLVGNHYCDLEINNFIFSNSLNQQNYEMIINSICNQNNQNKTIGYVKRFKSYPKEWNSILNEIYNYDTNNKPIIINDKNTIDWLNRSKIENGILFIYQTFELANYKIENDGFEKHTLDSYHYPFLKSIQDCNIKELSNFYNYIQNKTFFNRYGTGTGSNIYMDDHSKLPLFFKFETNKITPENIIQLLNFLNSNQFKYFSKKMIENLIKTIANYWNEASTTTTITTIINNDNNIKLSLFLESVIDVSPNLFKFLIENEFYSILNIDEIKNEFISKINEAVFKHYDSSYSHISNKNEGQIFHYQSCLFYFNEKGEGEGGKGKGSIPYYCTSNESPNNIIECFKIIISKIKIVNQLSENQIESFKLILNYFYNRLIRSKFTNQDDIIYIRSLVSSNHLPFSFNFNNTAFHSFYHLLIKSPIYINFIMNTGLLKKYQTLIKGGSSSLDYSIQPSLNNNQIIQNDNFTDCLIKPNYFSFEFIFKNQNNQGEDDDELLLDALITNFIYSNNMNQTIYFQTKSINSTLEFLLINHKFNLFFKQLEIISNSNLKNQFLISGNVLKKAMKHLDHFDENEQKSFLSFLKYMEEFANNSYNNYNNKNSSNK